MSLEIKTLPAMRLAAVQHTGPYNQIAPAFRELGRIAGPAGLFAHPGAMMMGLYKDDPATTPASQLRSAAGIVIPEEVTIPPGLVEERVGAGRFACGLHVGPYEALTDAWARFKSELSASPHQHRSATSYEVYLNDPSQVQPADLKTEICMPVK
jgi:AraC family transcriptional regulator